MASLTTGGGPVAQMAMGAFTGGAVAEITGGNFVEGFATGLTVSALNHALHSVAIKLQKDPLQRFSEKAKTLEEWTNRYEDSEYLEIIFEDGIKGDGLPAGPIDDFRYVKNPIDGKVMDMRHVSIVGYGSSSYIGEVVEFVQWSLGDPSNSAFGAQDYYSNKIGFYFKSLRQTGNWASKSWAYDFKRFILTQYRSLSISVLNYAYTKYKKYGKD